MKKSLRFISIIALAAIMAFGFLGCDNGSTSDSHTHTWGNWVTDVQVTSTAIGKDKRTCTGCAESETRDVQWYELDDTGPGGGKIYYRNEAGFVMTDTGDTAHYLEAAPADVTTPGSLLLWGAPYTPVSQTNIEGARGLSIGAGQKNTKAILAVVSTDPAVEAPAAHACNTYAGGGKTDWFFPSRDELDELYTQKKLFDNWGTGDYDGYYWSSSQVCIDDGDNDSRGWAWIQIFDSGNQFSYYTKAGCELSVRPIRAF